MDPISFAAFSLDVVFGLVAFFFTILAQDVSLLFDKLSRKVTVVVTIAIGIGVVYFK